VSELDLRMRHPHRSQHGRTGRSCLVALLAVAVVVGVVGFVVYRGADMVSGWFADPEDYTGKGTGSVRVEVVQGDSAADIGTTLEDAGVVASAEAFTDAASADPRSRSIQPGRYEMREEMSATAALGLLIEGEVVVSDDVTVPEGFTVRETLSRLAEGSDLSAESLSEAARATSRLGLPSWSGDDVEGYLFPSTYTVDPGASANDVLAQMVSRFREVSADIALERGARRLGVTPREVVIVASLIQAEASRPQDFGKVARVIYNRLDDKMLLQLDSTVKFAEGSSDSIYTTAEERDNPSRYNTYRYKGLPPTAINSPGEQALRAALDPTPGDWMYFVTVDLDTGRTLFAETFRQHQRYVAKLTAYCRESDMC